MDKIGFRSQRSFKGLFSQARKPIKVAIKSINKKSTEKPIVFSGLMPRAEKKNKRVASLVPNPKIEIGIKPANAARETEPIK